MSNLAATHRYDNISSCGTTYVLLAARVISMAELVAGQPPDEHVLHARFEEVTCRTYFARDIFIDCHAFNIFFFFFISFIINLVAFIAVGSSCKFERHFG